MISAGAMRIARIIYAGVVGMPMPSRMLANIATTSIGSKIPWAISKRENDTFAPSPVKVKTPTTMPAHAHASAT